MRRLGLLAAALASLAGCALLAPAPGTLPPSVDLGAILVCEGVERATCEQEATEALLFVLDAGSEDEVSAIRSVTVSPGGRIDVCWDGQTPCAFFVVITPPPE